MLIWHRKDSVHAMHQKRAEAARAEAINAQVRVAVTAYAAAAIDIPDTQALEMPDLFPTWEQVLAAGQRLPAGRILNQGGQLYRVVKGITPLESQPPGGEGMLAEYRPIDQSHTGTQDDPIPWVYGMDCNAGTYYTYQGHVYQVAEGGSMIPCIWPPDTAGLWQWILVE